MMNQKVDIYSFLSSSLGTLFSVVSTFLLFVLAARILNLEQFGIFSFSYALNSFGGLLLDFGYPLSLLHRLHNMSYEHHRVIPLSMLAAKIVILIPTTIGIYFISEHFRLDISVVLIIWVGVIFQSFGIFFASALRAFGCHKEDAKHSFTSGLIAVSYLGMVLFSGNQSIWILSVSVPLSGLSYLILSYLYIKKININIDYDISMRAIRHEFKQNFPYAVDAVARKSYGLLDIFILASVGSFSSVGLYQAAQKIAQFFTIFAQPFSNVLVPMLTKLNKGSKKIQIVLVVQLIFAFVSACVYLVVSPSAIDFLISDQLDNLNLLLLMFSMIIFVRFCVSALSIEKTAMGLIRVRLLANITGAVGLVLFGLFFASRFGASGMAASAILSSILSIIILVMRK